MSQIYFSDEKYVSVDFSEVEIPEGEYENCIFEACNFAGANLSKAMFSECAFSNCDFSNARLGGTALQDVRFQSCKLLGLAFEACNPFLLSFYFQDCILNFSSFFKMNLKNTFFDTCKLEQVDFSDADFSKAVFKHCDLRGAIFFNTRLEAADFSTSQNFSIDPGQNIITGAKFSSQNLQGLLNKYKIEIV